MKNLTRQLLAAVMVAASVTFSGNTLAQTRRTTTQTGNTSTTSSSSSSSRSSQSVSRSTSGQNRSTATQNRSTTTQNRSTATQNRSTSNRNSGNSATASRTIDTRNRTISTTGSQSGSSNTQVRRTTGSQNTTGSQSGSSSTQVRRTTGTQNTTGSQSGRSNTQVRRTTGTQNTTGSQATGSQNSQVRRTAGTGTQNRAEGNATTTSSADRSTAQIRNVTVNDNVTRRGLGTVGKNDQSKDDRYDRPSDRDDRYAGRGGYNDRYYDDCRMDGHNVHRVHPRERDFMPCDRIDHFWGHGPHYFGYRVRTLPPRYVRVRYYGVDYYRYGNVYYRPYGGYYVVCRPPFGVVIDGPVIDLGFHTVRFAFYTNVYRTYSGFDSYSRYIDDQNRRIAQNNAILAQQNARIAMNLNAARSSYELANALGLVQSYAYANEEYYYSDGVFYTIKGNSYQTIVPPAGALVDELPDDYDTIVFGGVEYYRVDDTVYRMVMVGGRPCLEVLGQMYGSLARQYSLY